VNKKAWKVEIVVNVALGRSSRCASFSTKGQRSSSPDIENLQKMAHISHKLGLRDCSVEVDFQLKFKMSNVRARRTAAQHVGTGPTLVLVYQEFFFRAV